MSKKYDTRLCFIHFHLESRFLEFTQHVARMKQTLLSVSVRIRIMMAAFLQGQFSQALFLHGPDSNLHLYVLENGVTSEQASCLDFYTVFTEVIITVEVIEIHLLLLGSVPDQTKKSKEEFIANVYFQNENLSEIQCHYKIRGTVCGLQTYYYYYL